VHWLRWCANGNKEIEVKEQNNVRRKTRPQVARIRAQMVPLDPPRQSFSQRFEALVKEEKELLEDLTGTLHEKHHENNEK
jgi:hypothetical protein